MGRSIYCYGVFGGRFWAVWDCFFRVCFRERILARREGDLGILGGRVTAWEEEGTFGEVYVCVVAF